MYSGNSEVAWDIRNLKQAEEAKSHYLKARKENRRVLTEDGQEVDAFAKVANLGVFRIEAVETGRSDLMALHILDETGDRRIPWCPTDPEQIKEAAELFNQYIKKGWKAYAVHRVDPNKKGVRVYEFDPTLEEVIFDDRSLSEKIKNFAQAIVSKEKKVEPTAATVKRKLKNFAESFSEIKLLPKTYPG